MTRLSLFYLAGYLLPTGLLLLVTPQPTLRLLLSNGNYADVFPRAVGMLLLAIGIIVVQIIRRRVKVLYPTTPATGLIVARNGGRECGVCSFREL